MGLIRRRSESKFTSELMNSNWHLNSVLTETEIEPVGPGQYPRQDPGPLDHETI